METVDSRTMNKVLQLAQKNSQRKEKLESTVNEKINEVLTKLEELKQSKYEDEEIKEKGRSGKGKKAKNEFYQVNIYFIIIFLFMPFNNLIYIIGSNSKF